MTYYDRGRDPNCNGVMNTFGMAAPISHVPAQTKRALASAQAESAPGNVGDLDFVIQLIEQIEALHKDNPDAEISLSVDGKWRASLIETEIAYKDGESGKAA